MQAASAVQVRFLPRRIPFDEGEEMPRDLEVTDVQELLDAVERHINQSEFYPRSNVYLDIVLLALMSKSLTVARAICTLVGAGFPEEAFGLGRTLLDIYFTVRYIANRDSLDRAKRYAEFYAKDYEAWIRLIEKYYPGQLEHLPEHHDEMTRIASTFPSPYRWSGLGDQTKQMATEESVVETAALGKPVTAAFDYEVVYKWTSHYVHPTVVALESHNTGPREAFRAYAGAAKRRHSKRLGQLALFNVVACLAKIIVCAFRGLKDEVPAVLSDRWDSLLSRAVR
jgi:Family of unknown function (DUF5677)